jgi:hypothetical protein
VIIALIVVELVGNKDDGWVFADSGGEAGNKGYGSSGGVKQVRKPWNNEASSAPTNCYNNGLDLTALVILFRSFLYY